MIWEVRPIAAPNPGFMIQLKALEKNVLGQMSECDVMQGMWKEKMDALKNRKKENGESTEVKLPTDEAMILNAESQLSGHIKE
mmetsp:Transcript_18423/g.31508  ORF Transcript_18423/g.31508 Transcript_18423/m.31508 type:complete len:83 (+) Transcript_18423:619-867(+)|eukprot:CAMPEP_0168627986 /NCGR_PEP_ID=MMETSP0449_2-20121227/11595_1 /TAXON_ID=1082188 /ORGANISM="Strombidium rassoulzadegani, Strain ras09" /LENGTH=82 /DNA_ID=CAMNT_0008670359 /DNA_START=553 /DNA_END=801 /DNA_ORIENTATION=-